jgi:preprotein translocase subunit SecB
MNPRIQELAQQATEDILGVKIVNQQHFAELIIAECCVALHPMLRDMISRHKGWT